MISTSNEGRTKTSSEFVSISVLALCTLVAHFGYVYQRVSKETGNYGNGVLVSSVEVAFLTLKILFCTGLAISFAQFLNRSQIEAGEDRLIRNTVKAQNLILTIALAFAFVSAIALQVFELPDREFHDAVGISKSATKISFLALILVAASPLNNRAYRDFSAAAGFTQVSRSENVENRLFLKMLQRSSMKFVIPAFAVYAAGSIAFHRLDRITTVEAAGFQGAMAVLLAFAVGDAVYRACKCLRDGGE